MAQGVKQLSELRDRLELTLSIPSGSAYVDSTPELDDINEAYQATAYAYDWPFLLDRVGIVKVANLDRYAIPSTFRKARTIKLDDVLLGEAELESLKRTRNSYAIDKIQGDIILHDIPSTASTAYTLSNAESAGNAVTIELDTVSGLSQHDEIWIDSVSGTDEFSMVSSIGTLSIVARLYAAKSASDKLYRQDDIIDILFYKTVALLSAAGDKTVLPGALDYIMLEFAAHLAYSRLEQFDEAEKHRGMWERELNKYFLAFDKNSTGLATEFGIA